MSETDSTQPRAAEISNVLRDEILLGQYRVGERLPSERDLAARFSVNRGSVREAIKILAQLGIVTVQPGGVRIVALEEASLGVLGPLLDLQTAQRPNLVADLVEVFGALLALSAKLALQKATPQQKKELVGLLSHTEQSPNGGSAAEINGCSPIDAREEALEQFFMALNQINDNLVLRLIGNGLKTQILGRIERRNDPITAFFDALASAVQDDDAYALARAIIQRMEEVSHQLKTAGLKPQDHLDRNTAHV